MKKTVGDPKTHKSQTQTPKATSIWPGLYKYVPCAEIE